MNINDTFAANVEQVDIEIDETTGDVGLRFDSGSIFPLSPNLAVQLARALLRAVRQQP